MELDKIKELAESDLVKEGINFKDLIGKELMLGQSRYVCRYGTLSDGHDKITESQRYYQSIKEMYGIANEMSLNMARAMEAQADLLEAESTVDLVEKEWEILRLKAKIFKAQTQLNGIYIMLQDQARMLDEYNKVRLELQESVRTKYPHGIEQAEQDNWKSVGEYWAFKKQIGANSNPMTHLPLEPTVKAKLGVETNCLELVGWLVAQNKDEIGLKYNGNVKAFIEDKLSTTMNLGGRNVTKDLSA